MTTTLPALILAAALSTAGPDPTLTPGAALPVDAATVCQPGYAKQARAVTQATKRRVFAEYGFAWERRGEYEVDHLISLELGGSNDIKNLWPEPYAGADGARVKDKLENRLHAMVCGGEMELGEAQAIIAGDWEAAAARLK